MADKPHKETIEDQLKRHGIKPAPPDHPIYRQGYSINFVKRPPSSTAST
jgi:hypothetical protein